MKGCLAALAWTKDKVEKKFIIALIYGNACGLYVSF